MSELIRWQTPFTEAKYPSVGLFIQHEKESTDTLSTIVCPEGIDEYPKYIVSFGSILAFHCNEEAHLPERDWEKAKRKEKDLCAYQWINSPDIKSYMGAAFVFYLGELYHYLIFGDDNIVEVLTPNIPKIEVVDNSRTINIKLKI